LEFFPYGLGSTLPPDTWKIINEFKDKEFIEQIRGLVITLSDTQKDFMEKNSKKVRFLKIGYLSLLIGFLLLIPKKNGILFHMKHYG